MPEWLKVALPYVVPVVLAGLVALAGITFAGRTRLRRDLSTDASVVVELKQGSLGRQALELDMERRTTRLVILSRVPAIRGGDVVRFAALLVTSTIVLLSARDLSRAPAGQGPIDLLIPALGLASVNAVLWFSFLDGWQGRADLRHRLHEVLDIRWDESAVVSMASRLTLAVAGTVIVVAPPAWLIFGALRYWDVERPAGLPYLLLLTGAVSYVMLHTPKTEPTAQAVRQVLESTGLAAATDDTDTESAMDPLASSPIRRLLRWVSYLGVGGVPS